MNREKALQTLLATRLFDGIDPADARVMVSCLEPRLRTYEKGEVILMAGDTTSSLGLVVEGAVRVESTDVWGNVSVVGAMGKGELFAEAYAAMPKTPLLITVMATKPTTVLWLEVLHVVSRCKHVCARHDKLNENLLAIIASKNLQLSQRILDSAPKSIQGKVLAYLSTQSKIAGSPSFDIPFNRQQLADYLGVDRSALCTVLTQLQARGVLTTRRSHFELSPDSLA